MKVSIIGLGYVGLPLAIAASKNKDLEVIGYDIDTNKVDQLNSNICPFKEADIEKELLDHNVKFSCSESDLTNSKIYIICVPTPVKTNFLPNLKPLKSASSMVAELLTKDSHIIIESTINPGVCEEIIKPLLEEVSNLKAGSDFGLAHCPERINPGDPKWNVYNIPRNIGSLNKEHTKFLADFYRSFLNAKVNEVSTVKIAEATKIIENTFRDVNIAFVNELAQSFDKLGIDLIETITAASNKPFAFLAHYPGCGVGGHCIPVDPYYLISRAEKSGFNHEFLKKARDVNKSMPEYTINLLVKELNKLSLSIKDTNILLYGLSYKANVGDLRESPALKIEKLLIEWGANVETYDPFVNEKNKSDSLEDALKNKTAVVIATNHNQIINFDFNKTDLKLIVDGRNCINQSNLKNISYTGIGRGI